MFVQVKQYTMNPKAMPRQQLLGHIDIDTREWADGVLTNSARNVVREPQGRKPRAKKEPRSESVATLRHSSRFSS